MIFCFQVSVLKMKHKPNFFQATEESGKGYSSPEPDIQDSSWK